MGFVPRCKLLQFRVPSAVAHLSQKLQVLDKRCGEPALCLQQTDPILQCVGEAWAISKLHVDEILGNA